MKNLALLSAIVLTITWGLFLGTIQMAYAISWQWNYSGDNVIASGTFITNDTPDSLGFYQISEITGTRNGDKITGLQPAGTPIPGNEPFIVDNLISLNPQQLTVHGFGYSTASGNYCNPFFAGFLPMPGYLEFLSGDVIKTDSTNLGLPDNELRIIFDAKIINVPNSK